MKKALIVLAAVLAAGLPAIALASAGFAKQSLFLSQGSVTAGQTVLIHAVVSNDAAAKFSGTLVFGDEGGTVGTVPVALPAGASSVVSVSWMPAAGVHNVTAALEDSAGNSVETESASFTVNAPPAPASQSPAQPAAVESSQQIQNDIAQYSPQAAQTAQPVFSAVDSLRTSAASALTNQLNATKQSLGVKPQGEVLGASTEAPAAQSAAGSGFWFVLKTFYVYVLTILLFLIDSAAIFYPLLLIIFFYLMWRLFRRVRRPSY
jgi:hypothetical protein